VQIVTSWIFPLVVLVILTPARTVAQSQPEIKSLVGLWGCERDLDRPWTENNTLEIDTRNSPWKARVDGYVTDVEHSATTVSFTLPDHAGSFIGRLTAQSIVGHCVQAVSMTLHLDLTPTGDLYGGGGLYLLQAGPMPDCSFSATHFPGHCFRLIPILNSLSA
jgi:hypothetical protein